MVLQDFHAVNPTVARILVLSWLLKDFGWMTTNIYLGFSFGIISVLFHYIMIIIDTRQDFKFYNFSLFFWVAGNFIWMTLEFVVTTPSSYVHIGPAVPLGGFGEDTAEVLVQIKTFLFFLGAIIQLYMYMGILLNKIGMPRDEEEDDEEDEITRKELMLLFYGQLYSPLDGLHSYRHIRIQNSNNSDEFLEDLNDPEEIGNLMGENNNNNSSNNPLHDSNSNNSNSNSRSSNNIRNSNNRSSNNRSSMDSDNNDVPIVTVAFLENAYIVFWISKDLFWSWGTGDLDSVRELAVPFEIAGMLFGTLSIGIYMVNAYVSRHQTVRFIDCITTVCWIMANYVWMCGEFFIRYQHLNLDDANEGHDNITRIISSALFLTGLVLQIGNIIYLARKDESNLFKIIFGKICYKWQKGRNSPYGSHSVQYKKLNRNIEMLSVSPQKMNSVIQANE